MEEEGKILLSFIRAFADIFFSLITCITVLSKKGHYQIHDSGRFGGYPDYFF